MKNKAAQQLARIRWKGVSDGDRRAHALKMLAGRKDRDSKGRKPVEVAR